MKLLKAGDDHTDLSWDVVLHYDRHYRSANYLTITVHMGERSLPVRKEHLDLVLKWLARFNYGIERNVEGRYAVVPTDMLLNAERVESRRRARRELGQAKTTLETAQRMWRLLKRTTAERVPMLVFEAHIRDISAWPEVVSSAWGKDSITTVEGVVFTPEPGHILVYFWPVWWHKGSTHGLGIPMLYDIAPDGNVTSKGNVGQPHSYTDSGICTGNASMDGLAQTLDIIRDWYVGTDGSPVDGSDFQHMSQDWWSEWRMVFFDRFMDNAKYIYAPNDYGDDADIMPLTPAKLDELQRNTPSYSAPTEDEDDTICTACGTHTNSAWWCERCHDDFCGDDFNEDLDMCNDCAASHKADMTGITKADYVLLEHGDEDLNNKCQWPSRFQFEANDNEPHEEHDVPGQYMYRGADDWRGIPDFLCTEHYEALPDAVQEGEQVHLLPISGQDLERSAAQIVHDTTFHIVPTNNERT